MQPDDVTRELVLDGADGRRRVTAVRLSWRRDDPLAVTVRLVARPPHPSVPRTSWAVLRDFLRYGLEVATGDGDVRIRPAADCTYLELHSHGHVHTVAVPTDALASFLDETERVVPAGAEAGDAAMDELIARLLSR